MCSLLAEKDGKLLLIVASVLFGAVPAVGKALSASGLSPFSIVYYTQAIIAFISLCICKIQRIPLKITDRAVLLRLMAGGLCGSGGTTLLLNLAYLYIPVGMTTIIHFCYPLFIVCAMRVFWRQKIPFIKKLALVICFVGIYFMSKGTGGVFHWRGILFAVMSALTYACYMILCEKRNIAKISPCVRMFYFSASVVLGSSMVLLLCPAVSIQIPRLAQHVFLLVLFGVCSMSAHICLGIGITKEGATNAALIAFLEPITAAMLGCCIYHESITWHTAFGMASILFLQVIQITQSKREKFAK